MGALRDLESRIPARITESLTHRALASLARTGLRKFPVAVLEGVDAATGSSARMLLAGHPPSAEYLPQCFFRAVPERVSLGNFSFRSLHAVVEAHRALVDLTVLRLDRSSARRWTRDPSFIAVPEWIGTRIEVPADLESLLRSGNSIKRDMSLVRRNGFEPAFDDDEASFRYFYSDVYRPYAQQRYGDDAYTRTPSDLRRRLHCGGMIWVVEEGKRVAGALYELDGNELVLLAMGSVNGDFEPVKRGALAALYYYTLQTAQRIGSHAIDLRGCRPALSDGVLAYKQKWGAAIGEKAETYYDLLLRWDDPNPVVRAFFAKTPMIFRDGSGLSGLTGADPEQARGLWAKGLRSIYRLTDDGRVAVPRP